MSTTIYLLAAFLLIYLPASTHAHGRMLMPPSRMSAYLAGFSTPVNYLDHQMNCGGRKVQWDQNGGKCGICGDPWSGPRLYERPDGRLVQHDVITEVYKENDVITIEIQITANHKGWMEFRLCDIAKSGGVEATHECLDQNLLADELGQTRFYLETTNTGMFEYVVVLPEGLTCEHCLLQWKWKCGNDWGCGPKGCCTGCGERQEEFYACSDITIEPRNGRFTTRRTTRRPTTTTTTTQRPTTRRPVYTQSPTTRRPVYTQSPTTRRPVYIPTTRRPVYTQSPTTRRPVYTQSPTTRRPVYTQSPTTRRPVYTQSPTTRRPVYTQSPTTRRPVYTLTTRGPVYPYRPTTRRPTPKPAGPISVFDYFRKNQKPKTDTGARLVFNNPQAELKNNDDNFLDMVLGRRYTVYQGRIVPPSSNYPNPNGVSVPAYVDENDRNRLCATCMYGCRFQACSRHCPTVCPRTTALPR